MYSDNVYWPLLYVYHRIKDDRMENSINESWYRHNLRRAGNLLIGFPSESLVFCEKLAHERFAQKNEWFAHSLIFGERPERFAHIAHFRWATWAIRYTSITKKEGIRSFFKEKKVRSRSLICHEQPKQIAHGRSFVLIDLSDSLTIAHLSWAIWANRSQSLIWFDKTNKKYEEIFFISKFKNAQFWGSPNFFQIFFFKL